ENRRKLTAGFARGRTRDERDRSPVELGFAHQKAGRYGHADPAVLEYINGKTGMSRSEFAVDAKVVVYAGEGGLDRRRFGFVLGRIGLGAERFIFIEADDDPARAGRTRRLVGRECGSGGERCRKEGNRETLRERSSWKQKNRSVDHLCVLALLRFAS